VGFRLTAWKWVLVIGLGAVAGYFALPGPFSQDIAYLALGIASVACIVAGARWHEGSDRLSWYLLAVGGACFALADSVESFYGQMFHQAIPFPSWADPVHLVAYPFIFAGVLRLTGSANLSLRREENADAAIVTIGALSISWHFLMQPYVHDSSLSTTAELVNLAYPIMDIALIFLVSRALLFGNSRRPFHVLLATGLIVLFVGDFIYDLMVLHDSYTTGNPVDALFLIEYVLIAAAALHPSVAEPRIAPVTQRPRRDVHKIETRPRMPVVILAGFVPAVMLVVCASLQLTVNVAVLAGFCVAVFALVYVRMTWLFQRTSRQSLEIGAHAGAIEASLLERDELEMELRHLAFHDELTGLPNRSLLHDRVEHALASSTRSGRPLALCFGDLDSFKTVNDTLGHRVGDTVLMEAGSLLAAIVRPGDTVARLGGDEFAVLMIDVEEPESAIAFAHRIVSTLHDAIEVDGSRIGLSISVGVAFADETKSAEQLISEADSAMYEAKANGKNRVEVFQSEMRSRMLERLELTSGFRGALERSEFILRYQPIFSLADSRLTGFEALVRWEHPVLGLVAPLRFIPLAEETGFIVPLGRWVLAEACEQLSTWSHRLDQPLTMAVNLSRRQLVSPYLGDEVRTALAFSGIAPQQLVLEVTETVLMVDPERATEALCDLRSTGVRIAVDDFGTGYSSLSHLQEFPVDVLKIDKSFIDRLDDAEPQGAAVVTSIIQLARSLGLRVVAEGIEHEAQRQKLIDLGCESGQGYLMARPLDKQAVSSLIEAHADTSDAGLENPLRPATYTR
jgi:diguanylate cyclase